MIPILLAAAIIGILLIIVIAGQPDEFKVTRTATIAASPEIVLPYVNELKRWDTWSPWAKLDPNAKNSFDGPDIGVGSAMSWSGNKKIGAGRMTITDYRAVALIRFKLEFLRPFKVTNTAEFAFQPEGNQTVVTWTMSGRNNFFFKVFGLFMDCDTMAGKDFEKGLASLKAVAETAK